MIRIVVDYDRVGIPQPVGNIAELERRDAPVEVVEPEPRRAAALKMKHMAWSEAAREMPVFERMVQMELSVVPSSVVPNPLAVMFDMRRIGMSRLVLEVSLHRSRVRSFMGRWCFVRRRSLVWRGRRMHGRRTVRRYISPTHSASAASATRVLLRVAGNRCQQKHSRRDRHHFLDHAST
jgi:hypothetical protein